WGPVEAASCLKQLTGVEDTTWTRVTQNPDGSVQHEGVRRPLRDVQRDCAAWVARHRALATKAVEKPAEPWAFTPEPRLPGLNVPFTMPPAEVLAVYRRAGLACQHSPEKRWQNGGTHFFSPETVTATTSCMPALNRGLVSISYVFDAGKLSEIHLLRVGHGDPGGEPLKGPLRLPREGATGWAGLDGALPAFS